MKTFTVYAGNEYRAYVNSIYCEDEFFYQEYQQAAYCIEEIVRHSQEFIDNSRVGYEKQIQNEQELLRGFSNNIVAFCAKRGQGKTSAMLSMAKALQRLPDGVNDESDCIVKGFWNEVCHKFRKKGYTSSCVLDNTYAVLEAIEPSTMEQNDSVMRVIIGNMYKELEQYWKELDRKTSEKKEKKTEF